MTDEMTAKLTKIEKMAKEELLSSLSTLASNMVFYTKEQKLERLVLINAVTERLTLVLTVHTKK